MHLGFQLIDLLFTKASAEMVSVEDRLSRKGNKEKSCAKLHKNLKSEATGLMER